ncbi:COG4705 family protein [Saccharopolyspora sp. NPDC002376]
MTTPAPGAQSRADTENGPAEYIMRKLPHVTALFWLLKIVAVTIGETGSDLFAIELQLGYLGCAVAFFVFFLIAVGLQLRAKRFHPGIFWTVVLATSIVGTATSDLMDRGFGHSGDTSNGIGYGAGAIILTAILAIVFLAWWRTGQTFDVEKIATRKGEALYWVAILVSNTLDTASGDWLSDDVGLGFRNTFLIIAGVMLVLLAAHYLTSINGEVLFWFAFILTRPLSAAAGDSLTKPADDGGLGLGTRWGTVALLVVLGALIAYQAYRVRKDPLDLLPAPTHRITGQSQQPNGQVVMAYGRRADQIVERA